MVIGKGAVSQGKMLRLGPIFFNLWNMLRPHEGSSIDVWIDIEERHAARHISRDYSPAAPPCSLLLPCCRLRGMRGKRVGVRHGGMLLACHYR